MAPSADAARDPSRSTAGCHEPVEEELISDVQAKPLLKRKHRMITHRHHGALVEKDVLLECEIANGFEHNLIR